MFASACPGQELPPVQTVFVIVLENTAWSGIHGNPSAPYLNGSLLPTSSSCNFYHNVPGLHPSLPNYLWMEAGTNFGIFDDDEPAANHQNTTNHLVTLLRNAGIPWKAYQENISGTSLPLVTSPGYSARHNPFIYFDDVTGTNNPSDAYGLAHIRPYGELAQDLTNGALARFNFIIPSDCNDMHTDCPPLMDRTRQGDDWLAAEVPKILASPAFTNNGVLIVTWDESYDLDERIGLLLLSPLAKGKGYVSTNYYTHSSLLRTLQEIFGVFPLLGDAAAATNLSDLFSRPGLTGIEMLSGGGVRLTATGLRSGQNVVLQTSVDLASWSSLSTNVATTPPLVLTNYPPLSVRRFYRLVQIP